MMSDLGKELFRDGDWVLYVDYLIRHTPGSVHHSTKKEDRIICIGHYCRGDEWKHRVGRGGWYRDRCPNCQEPVPEKLIGFQKLVEWKR